MKWSKPLAKQFAKNSPSVPVVSVRGIPALERLVPNVRRFGASSRGPPVQLTENIGPTKHYCRNSQSFDRHAFALADVGTSTAPTKSDRQTLLDKSSRSSHLDSFGAMVHAAGPAMAATEFASPPTITERFASPISFRSAAATNRCMQPTAIPQGGRLIVWTLRMFSPRGPGQGC